MKQMLKFTLPEMTQSVGLLYFTKYFVYIKSSVQINLEQTYFSQRYMSTDMIKEDVYKLQ